MGTMTLRLGGPHPSRNIFLCSCHEETNDRNIGKGDRVGTGQFLMGSSS
jgi:hypothetical protein